MPGNKGLTKNVFWSLYGYVAPRVLKKKLLPPKNPVSMFQVRNKVVSVNMQVCVSW